MSEILTSLNSKGTQEKASLENPHSGEILKQEYSEYYPNGGDIVVNLGSHSLYGKNREESDRATQVGGELGERQILHALATPEDLQEQTFRSQRYPGIGEDSNVATTARNGLVELILEGKEIIPQDCPLDFFDEEFTGMLKAPLHYQAVAKNVLSNYTFASVLGIALSPLLVREWKKTVNAGMTRRSFLALSSKAIASLLATAVLRNKVAESVANLLGSKLSFKESNDLQIRLEQDLPDFVYDPSFITYTEALIRFRNLNFAYNLHRIGQHNSKQHQQEKLFVFYGNGHSDFPNLFKEGPKELEQKIRELARRAFNTTISELLEKGITYYIVENTITTLGETFVNPDIISNNYPANSRLQAKSPSPKAIFFEELEKAINKSKKGSEIRSVLEQCRSNSIRKILASRLDLSNALEERTRKKGKQVSWNDLFGNESYVSKSINAFGMFIYNEEDPLYKKGTFYTGYVIIGGNVYPEVTWGGNPEVDPPTKPKRGILLGNRLIPYPTEPNPLP